MRKPKNGLSCIYIGDGCIRNFKQPVWFEGIGTLEKSEINFGRTGVAYYDHTIRKWDFRPDGLNIRHLVNRKDLFWPGIDK
jgi:hypothetical protein